MHVVFVHKNFPAQFGHIGRRLVERLGFRCAFVTEQPEGDAGPISRLLYNCSGGATRLTHPASRSFESFTWRGHAVLAALQNRGDIRPDVIVGHSGFGSTLFLRDFYACPIINFCEWFYRWHGAESELLNQRGGPNCMNRLTDRCRNAMLLADLDAATLAYSPTNWQRSRIPHEYQHKLETIFDGIDTRLWRPLSHKERGFGRWIAGKWIPWRKRIVTYVSRGFESMRGFDVFMQVAKRICERRKDVVFLCIGSDRVCYGGDLAQIKEKSFREHVLGSGQYDLDRFIFTGPIPPEELRRAFAFSDLHIYLTVPFILSWSLMDALACGCTVLVSDTPPLREVIEHGKNGLMAPYFDVDHFVELALGVLDDPAAYRRKLGQAGLAMIHEKYDLDVVLPRMIRLYERAQRLNAGGTSGVESATPRSEAVGVVQEINGAPRPSRTQGVPPGHTAPESHALEDLKRAHQWPADAPAQPTTDNSSDDGWLTPGEQAMLQAAIPKTAKLILELGAWRGQTTKFLAELCPEATILAVDAWHGEKVSGTDCRYGPAGASHNRFLTPFREEHPEWKAMLPDVWESFIARLAPYRDRVIPLRKRHDDAIREVAAAGLVPDAVYYDPDYNSRLLRETLVALVRAFPGVRVIGHDWLWHRVQAELSLASRRTGRKLDARGNLWRLEPVRIRQPTPSGDDTANGRGRDSFFAAGNADGWLGSTNGSPQRRALGAAVAATSDPRHPGALPDPLRVLVTIPHYFRADSSRLYGSGSARREERVAAVRACLSSVYETIGGTSYTANLVRPENLPANAATSARLHVVVCTSGDGHLLDEIDPADYHFETREVQGDPRFLGYACHEVLRDRLGEFDYYCYLEDDLVLSDPWIFAKLAWFRELAGEECVLQPNRFEVSAGIASAERCLTGRGRSRLLSAEEQPTGRKWYIDGDLPPEKSGRYQDVTDRPELVGEFLGQRVVFRRPLNPHAGCFFLTEGQMRTWSKQPYFLDCDASFYSPLEGAATVGVMRTFRVYKPSRENACFLEIRHVGDAWLHKLAERDRLISVSYGATRGAREAAANTC